MKITYLGHACFAIEESGFRVIVDPYEGVEGYGDLHAQGNAVYCSHGHKDHSFTKGVVLADGGTSPFSVREIPSFHDNQGGALRGENTIRVFTAGGVAVAHLGDLGHRLSEAQVEAIGQCDVLLLPVGGFYTVDAEMAREVAEQVKPRCIVPMHYRHAPYGLPNVDGVERFLSLYPAEAVKKAEGNSFFATADPLPQVMVLRYEPV